MSRLQQDSSMTRKLLESWATGDEKSVAYLLERHRPFLQQVIHLRMDPKLQTRLDPSDVVQDVHVEAVRRLPTYLDKRPMPFRLWLRQIAQDRLIMAWRQHVQTAQRSLEQEFPLAEGSSQQLANCLVAKNLLTPSEQFMKQEAIQKVRLAVSQLPMEDREILLMLNSEGLSSKEVGTVLNLNAASVRKRYGRILIKLQKMLQDLGFTESQS